MEEIEKVLTFFFFAIDRTWSEFFFFFLGGAKGVIRNLYRK